MDAINVVAALVLIGIAAAGVFYVSTSTHKTAGNPSVTVSTAAPTSTPATTSSATTLNQSISTIRPASTTATTAISNSTATASTTSATTTPTITTTVIATINYGVNGAFASNAQANLTLPAGLGYYICGAGVTNYTLSSWSWTQDISAGWSGIGHQSGNVCSLKTYGVANISFVGIGVADNVAPAITTKSQASNTIGLTYNVVADNSFVVIAGADGGLDNITAYMVPNGCIPKIIAQNNGKEPFAFVAVCPSQPSGTYAANFTTTKALFSYAVLAAYVFPPYNSTGSTTTTSSTSSTSTTSITGNYYNCNQCYHVPIAGYSCAPSCPNSVSCSYGGFECT